MKLSFVIKTPQDLIKARAGLDRVDLEGPEYEFILRPYKKDRSTRQNNLYWKWLNIWAEETGDIAEEMHHTMKMEYLPAIFERDDEDYAELIELARKLYKKGDQESKALVLKLAKKIAARLTTTHLNTKQFSEYLDKVQAKAALGGIGLPEPEDFYEQSYKYSR